MKKEKKRGKKRRKRKEKRKQGKTNDRRPEKCDARRSERKGKAAMARGTPYVLKRNRYKLHGLNNTKKIAAVARTKTVVM